jgi:23S rRNA pseudouridine1911/1915/1917 synthase
MPAKNIEPQIIAETEDYLVIDKPAGLIVHGAPGITEKTLVDWLIAHYPKIKSVGDDESRPGIVHRLDKEASGLMVIAKNQKSFDSLKKQFQKRQVTKKYLALVHGKIIKEDGCLNFPIKRARDGHRMAALPTNNTAIENKKRPNNRDFGTIKAEDEAKEAITEFCVLHRYINYTLLEVKIKTGRTHQIRVHMYAYGHPLLGDSLYFTKKTKVKNEKAGLNRLFLVSYELCFKDREGQKQIFTLKLPAELQKFLDKTK